MSLREHISKTGCPNKFSVRVARGCRSLLLRRRCDMSCTSGFVGDVIFYWAVGRYTHDSHSKASTLLGRLTAGARHKFPTYLPGVPRCLTLLSYSMACRKGRAGVKYVFYDFLALLRNKYIYTYVLYLVAHRAGLVTDVRWDTLSLMSVSILHYIIQRLYFALRPRF